jgi:glycerol-3-phosphate acyltransferase PlsY
VALAFFLGGVSPATIIGRVLGRDVAQSGSGNPGATNAGRVLGARWGVVVGVLDVLKGFVPAYLVVRFFDSQPLGYALGVAAVLGHVYSPYLRGRGGKGVATAFGAVLGVHPWYALAMVGLFLVVLVFTRWVALGSVVAATGLVGLGVAAAAGWVPGGWLTALWALTLGGIVLARHRPNFLTRLRTGPPT